MRMIQFNKMPTRMVEHNAETFGRMGAHITPAQRASHLLSFSGGCYRPRAR